LVWVTLLGEINKVIEITNTHQEDMTMITTLRIVAIVVRDQNKALKFYTEKLGFEKAKAIKSHEVFKK
jgi:hypothetical protein